MAAKDEDPAFEFLFTDLVEHILSLAGDPRGCVAYIAGEIRALVGARTIFIFECPDLRGGAAHNLVSALPERRRGLAEDPRVLDIVARGHDLEKSAFVVSGGDEGLSAILADVGIGDAIILPLRYADTRTGIILLLDLLDRANVGNLLSTFDRLSPILALIMRNGYLYENLEAEVDRRTRELEAKSAEVEASLREKEVLLKEIHHRVKNNLQIVNSLLYLRMKGIADERTRDLFAESLNRVQAMALVHEELYEAPDLSQVDMSEYISKLVIRLVALAPAPIATSFDLEPIRLTPDEAIPCGLMINELCMNAMKYAFAERPGGKLRISLKRREARILLTVEDDGPGLDPSLLEDGHGGGLGFSIIRSLAAQLHGALEVSPGPGARFKLDFPTAAKGATP
jgi:two-component sensor histidine kinase